MKCRYINCQHPSNTEKITKQLHKDCYEAYFHEAGVDRLDKMTSVQGREVFIKQQKLIRKQ